MLLSRRIAFSGISVSIILIFLSVSYFSPIADFALFSMTSLCIALIVSYAGFRTGFIAYAAASLLILFFFGILYAAPFVVLFGIFPVIKGVLESRMKKISAYIIKTLYFIALMVAGILIFSDEMTDLNIFSVIGERFAAADSVGVMAVFVLSGVAILLVYDYALTLLIAIFEKMLDKAIRK
ncbi:MAG: YybS family protein [Saccharofermentanales bacterium]